MMRASMAFRSSAVSCVAWGSLLTSESSDSEAFGKHAAICSHGAAKRGSLERILEPIVVVRIHDADEVARETPAGDLRDAVHKRRVGCGGALAV